MTALHHLEEYLYASDIAEMLNNATTNIWLGLKLKTS